MNGLETLKQFINEMTDCIENPKEYAKGYEQQIFYKYKYTLETTVKQAQEQEKVLEIIKRFITDGWTYFNLEDNYITVDGGYGLNEEEFNLLKRYFENGN